MDKALANLRLVFADLPRIAEPADAARLQAAAYCLDHGIAPRDLMKALDLDASVLNKFDPDQPRVPAGNGEESGRWTDETRQENFIPSLRPPRIRIAADGPFKPEGIETVPSGSIDPLDPANLNKVPPSPQEQQDIADTLNTLANGTPSEVERLRPHRYKNFPHFMTGAVLPPDPEGYKAFDVKSVPTADPGLRRLILSNSGTAAYYTSNHYFSFYAVSLSK